VLVTRHGRRLSGVALLIGGLGLALPVAATAQDSPHSVGTLRSPAQAAVVPDGVTTGDGRTAHGTDDAVLIGVGVAALLGSIGLFAAAQAAARQD
jgi:hypothetical protein